MPVVGLGQPLAEEQMLVPVMLESMLLILMVLINVLPKSLIVKFMLLISVHVQPATMDLLPFKEEPVVVPTPTR